MTSPRNPLEGFEELFDRMARQFESAMGPLGSRTDRQGRFDVSFGEPATGIDLADTDDAFVVTVDVPGYETDDLEITLSGDRLAISGEREHADYDESDEYIRRERRTDAFDRRVQLPAQVDAEETEAAVNNGVLTITLPKRTPDDGQTIDIE